MKGTQCLNCGKRAMSIVVSSDAEVRYQCDACSFDYVRELKARPNNCENPKRIVNDLKSVCPLAAYLFVGKQQFADHPLQMLLLEVFHRYCSDHISLQTYRVELAERLGVETRDTLCSWAADYKFPGFASRSNRRIWKRFESLVSGLGMTSTIIYRDQGIDTPLHELLRDLTKETPSEAYFRRMQQRSKWAETR